MNEIVFDRNGPLDWISENFTAFKLKSKGTTDSTKKKKRIDTARRGNVNFIRQWQIDRVCAICHKQILWRLKKLQAIYLYLNIKMDNKINQGHFIEFFLFFYYFYYYYIDNAWQIVYLNLIPFFSDKTNYILCHKMQFFKSWKEIYTTVLRINHKTFKDFIDEQKFSLINISLKENFLLEEVKVIFFPFFFGNILQQGWSDISMMANNGKEKTVTEGEFISSLGKRMLR